ncbi:hypothetical protein CC85DRAFT_154636 [Cutaneotrichosporon oleaginosum]|uniref:Uncharacterized protein n=1 Tax=Cutaneotrichosporon oleaginosum TaxID=879819 RepID=A0A0J0XW46_9TREE|nr:uncharacterized protein CC85DRAFT_154636 [Cutaneotrichosporon oleaginosum]KLT45296.1 hypothetical protein CC85DRAFT_154636 [Cutaneotrichosporon oleaginosum]TXT14875.1 hypothetical protein COLE_01068 [Cutaneotrichosporon oleaginosum]
MRSHVRVRGHHRQSSRLIPPVSCRMSQSSCRASSARLSQVTRPLPAPNQPTPHPSQCALPSDKGRRASTVDRGVCVTVTVTVTWTAISSVASHLQYSPVRGAELPHPPQIQDPRPQVCVQIGGPGRFWR